MSVGERQGTAGERVPTLEALLEASYVSRGETGDRGQGNEFLLEALLEASYVSRGETGDRGMSSYWRLYWKLVMSVGERQGTAGERVPTGGSAGG